MIKYDDQNFRNAQYQKRLVNLPNVKKQKLIETNKEKDNLHIVYVMRQVEVFGGTKVILEHSNRLCDMGIKVSIVCHFPKPDWFNVKSNYIQVPLDVELAEGIPECDVVIATSWYHLSECIDKSPAPVIFFEQGGSHIFDYNNLSDERRNTISKSMDLVDLVMTVSNNTADIYTELFKKRPIVFHNGLDTSIFYPGNKENNNKKPYIMMMGNEKNEFKRTRDIISAHKELVKNRYDVDLVWLTPSVPENPYGKVVVNAPQNEIGNYYRNAELFISASEYESFSLPPLEAFTCGCPVISSKNKGILEYATDNKDCLLFEIGDVSQLVQKIKLLLGNNDIKQDLIKNALETSKQFNWENTMNKILEYFKEIARYEKEVAKD